ncbi:MAG: hypothetical protein AB1634_11020 [Thermodesulfobacteriota bacterium]
MIHFDPSPEPPTFDSECRQKGAAWLVAHPGAERPRDYWTPFKSVLAVGFRDLCAYSAMYEPVGTVDHFRSWQKNPAAAYEWSNYRYASALMNSCKGTADVLDPFEVGADWFEILLPSLQLVVTDRVPPAVRGLAEQTLRRLHLRDDERVLRQRREWHRMYQDGELTLAGLWRKAPLIARAVEKQAAVAST